MSWSVGYDANWRRDIGYGVPAICDHPGCGAPIHRGMAHVCGGEPWGGDEGCGLFFCSAHKFCGENQLLCERCFTGHEPFTPTPDTAEWVQHKFTDPTWQTWRDEHPDEVAALAASLPTPSDPEPHHDR